MTMTQFGRRQIAQPTELSSGGSWGALDGVLMRGAGGLAPLTRRGFIGATAAVAVSAAAGMTGLLGTFSSPAGATGSCAHHCGPSPYCDGSDCDTSSSKCATADLNYASSSTCTSTTANYWQETWCPPNCSTNTGIYQCHDCCGQVQPTGATHCSGGYLGLCGFYWRCICKVKVGSC
jgi:hypothetical protein